MLGRNLNTAAQPTWPSPTSHTSQPYHYITLTRILTRIFTDYKSIYVKY